MPPAPPSARGPALPREHTAQVTLNQQVLASGTPLGRGAVSISRQAMVDFVRRIRANPIVRRIFQAARAGRPAPEVAVELMIDVLPAFERHTGLTAELVREGHPHYSHDNVAIEGEGIFIAEELLRDPDALVRELAHDIFSYLSAGREFAVPEALPFYMGLHPGKYLDRLLQLQRAGTPPQTLEEIFL